MDIKYNTCTYSLDDISTYIGADRALPYEQRSLTDNALTLPR